MNFRSISTLVTGANRGLGRAFAAELFALGVSRVYAAVRRPETLAAAFPKEPRIVPVQMNLIDLASIIAAAQAAPAISLLINNAATLELGEIFPDDGAKSFWAGFKIDPSSILFVSPTSNLSSN